MEERQIQEFVQRVSRDEALREDLINDPERVVALEELSPRVARVVKQLIPYLSLEERPQLGYWWSY